MRVTYLKLLRWLVRRELRRAGNKAGPSDITRAEVILWHDHLAIECMNMETPAQARTLGICLATNKFLEQGR